MSCTTHFAGATVIHRLDPRPRIVVTLLFAILLALTQALPILGAGLAVGMGAALLARLFSPALVRRLLHVNLFMALLFLTIPATTPGTPLFTLLTLPFSREGLRLALVITIKANAIVLVFTALLGTVELPTLGHALQHLRVPDRLVHLLLFTLRYLDVVHHAYTDLLRAMKARGFRPRMNRHTYRSYGALLAMLIVRSLERAERIVDAMKCRGFKGRFLTYRHFSFQRRDTVFCVLAAIVLLCFTITSWMLAGGQP